MRVIRQFSQGKITKEIATTMLKAGLGMTDSDINAMLGIDDDPSTDDFQFSALDDTLRDDHFPYLPARSGRFGAGDIPANR